MSLVPRLRHTTLVFAAAGALTAAVLVGIQGASAATGLARATAATAPAPGSPTDPNVRFVGRWDTGDSTGYLPKWAGAYVKVGFTGTTVKLKQRGTIDLFASVDGGQDRAFTGVSGTVNLTPTPLAPGRHTLRVTYRPVAGSYHGDAIYQGIILDAKAGTFAPSMSRTFIEFIGDSITVGQRTSMQAPTAYGWLAGDRLNAEHMQVAQGGACLVETDGCVGMSVRYFRTGPETDSPGWDFRRYAPAAVVVNLGTNDVAHAVHTPQFQSTYTGFLADIRSEFPDAVIFAIETFKRRYVTPTRNAVALRNEAGDRNVYFVNTEGWIDPDTDTADGVHPTDGGQRKIADRLAPIIAEKLGAPLP